MLPIHSRERKEWLFIGLGKKPKLKLFRRMTHLLSPGKT
jgi:hypothetical protein